MNILVDRFISDDDTTISRLLVDGRFICFGLEDEYREDKLASETRIPAGIYPVRLRTEGGFHSRYLARFPGMHLGMLHVQNVPDFEYILIHIGNTDADTAGCLLVGDQAVTSTGEMRVNLSKIAYEKLYPLVVGAAAADDLTIVYKDNDRAQEPQIMSLLDDNFEVTAHLQPLAAVKMQGMLRMLENYQTRIKLKNPEQDGRVVEFDLMAGGNLDHVDTCCARKDVTRSNYQLEG